MILSMKTQVLLFLLTIGLGVVSGFLYDVFRIIRKVFKHPNFLTYIEDILYWILVTFLIFYIMLDKNYGEIRAFSIGGVLLGTILYFLTISKLFVNFSMSIIHIIEKILFMTLKILFAPIKLVITILGVPYKIIEKIIKNMCKKSKKTLQKSKNYVKIKARRTKRNFKIIFKKI